jgi:hypothetical protein
MNDEALTKANSRIEQLEYELKTERCLSFRNQVAELEREKEFAQIITAGDEGIRNEQAALLRECRLALDTLLAQKPVLAGFKAGSTTLGNLRASLFEHRPQGVMGCDDDAGAAVIETNKVLAGRYFELLPKMEMLERENAELRKDAARYKWLIEYFASDATNHDDAIVEASERGPEAITAAIDEVMK